MLRVRFDNTKQQRVFERVFWLNQSSTNKTRLNHNFSNTHLLSFLSQIQQKRPPFLSISSECDIHMHRCNKCKNSVKFNNQCGLLVARWTPLASEEIDLMWFNTHLAQTMSRTSRRLESMAFFPSDRSSASINAHKRSRTPWAFCDISLCHRHGQFLLIFSPQPLLSILEHLRLTHSRAERAFFCWELSCDWLSKNLTKVHCLVSMRGLNKPTPPECNLSKLPGKGVPVTFPWANNFY